MDYITYQDKRYVTKVLKALVTQGIKITVEGSDLIQNKDVVENDVVVVTPSGEHYVILLGKIEASNRKYEVRMLSRQILKKALYESVNPPPVAQRTHNDTSVRDAYPRNRPNPNLPRTYNRSPNW